MRGVGDDLLGGSGAFGGVVERAMVVDYQWQNKVALSDERRLKVLGVRS
jgi:hypothetical protein